jgi:hypothetical protein
VLGLVAILAGGTALADVRPGECEGGKCQPPRTVCFNVECVYADHDGSKCQAAAVFSKQVTADGEEILDDSGPGEDATFEVACDDQVQFNGSAHRYTDRDGTRLQAVIGPFPAVLLPAHALREGHRYELSALDLGKEQSLRGYCYLYTGAQLR